MHFECNYAHYLFLSGQKEKALTIYKKYDGRKINDEMTWREMNLKDFKELEEISDYKEKFEEAKQLLGWN